MIVFGVFLITVALMPTYSSQELHPLSDEYIQKINNKQSTWKAGRNFEIDEFELFKVLANGIKSRQIYKENIKIHNEDEDMPESFDAREEWPDCADIIGLIRDQSRCGSCWAFASVEVMSDRICIHSNATRKLLVSAQDLLACGQSGGCEGGGTLTPFHTWETSGVVTGGLYNRTEQGCQSYFLPPCDDHVKQCRDYARTPSCKRQCDDTTLSYEAQKTYGQKHLSATGEKQIQLEIFKNGPVTTIFEVYADFANYKSGIYQYTVGERIGGHAVKILGWGVENGTKYWIVANSWNERWGDNGFFKIIRGQDEVGIEDYATAGLPDFSKF